MSKRISEAQFMRRIWFAGAAGALLLIIIPMLRANFVWWDLLTPCGLLAVAMVYILLPDNRALQDRVMLVWIALMVVHLVLMVTNETE